MRSLIAWARLVLSASERPGLALDVRRHVPCTGCALVCPGAAHAAPPWHRPCPVRDARSALATRDPVDAGTLIRRGGRLGAPLLLRRGFAPAELTWTDARALCQSRFQRGGTGLAVDPASLGLEDLDALAAWEDAIGIARPDPLPPWRDGELSPDVLARAAPRYDGDPDALPLLRHAARRGPTVRVSSSGPGVVLDPPGTRAAAALGVALSAPGDQAALGLFACPARTEFAAIACAHVEPTWIETAPELLLLPASWPWEAPGGRTVLRPGGEVWFVPEIAGPRPPLAAPVDHLLARLRADASESEPPPPDAVLARKRLAARLPGWAGVERLAAPGDRHVPRAETLEGSGKRAY
jgi:hypothetical protein